MRSLFISLAVASASLLSACNAGSTAPVAATAAISDPYAATAQAATGFVSGSSMASRTVYVYFDAQCSHCGHLWETMKAIKAPLRVVWIPVGLLSPASLSQGAALLEAADPVKAMNEHEAQFAKDHRGMSASVPSSAKRAIIQTNTKLLMSVGGDSVPYIVAQNPVTGALIKKAGSMPEAALRTLLGVPN